MQRVTTPVTLLSRHFVQPTRVHRTPPSLHENVKMSSASRCDSGSSPPIPPMDLRQAPFPPPSPHTVTESNRASNLIQPRHHYFLTMTALDASRGAPPPRRRHTASRSPGSPYKRYRYKMYASHRFPGTLGLRGAAGPLEGDKVGHATRRFHKSQTRRLDLYLGKYQPKIKQNNFENGKHQKTAS